MMSQKKCKDNIPMNITHLCKSKTIPVNDLKGIWLPIQKVAFSTEISYGMYEIIENETDHLLTELV